jgi:hypothetical protein
MTDLSVLVLCFPFSFRHGCIYISKMFCKEKRYQCVYVCHLVIQSQTIKTKNKRKQNKKKKQVKKKQKKETRKQPEKKPREQAGFYKTKKCMQCAF